VCVLIFGLKVQGVQGKFPDDISDAAVGRIFSGHKLEP
jgi:hypothetical protein